MSSIRPIRRRLTTVLCSRLESKPYQEVFGHPRRMEIGCGRKGMATRRGRQPSGYKVTLPRQVVCTRMMEADVTAIAKQAQIDKPVPDLATLKAYALIAGARNRISKRPISSQPHPSAKRSSG